MLGILIALTGPFKLCHMVARSQSDLRSIAVQDLKGSILIVPIAVALAAFLFGIEVLVLSHAIANLIHHDSDSKFHTFFSSGVRSTD